MPWGVRWALLALVVCAAFIAVVTPLFQNSGPVSAEITGGFPSQVSAGKTFVADIGIDNTGDSIISPICLQVTGDGGTQLLSGSFQGLETISAQNGRICGGALTGQETISVVLTFASLQSGSSAITVTPTRDDQVLGKGLSATVKIT